MAQSTLAAWNNATCIALDDGFKSSTSNLTVSQVAQSPVVKSRALSTSTSELVPRSTCTAKQVVGGDSCGSLPKHGERFKRHANQTIPKYQGRKLTVLYPLEWCRVF